MNQRARSRNAGLPGSREKPGHDAVYREIEIGISKDHSRRIPSELQRDALNATSGELIHGLAGPVAAGECDLRDVWMRNQGLADFGPVTCNDIDDAWRKARLLEQLSERERRYRRKLRRLQ